MITIEILDYNKDFVKQWNWHDDMPVPQVGDSLLLHFGDNNKDEYLVDIIQRVFSGVRPNVVVLVTDFTSDLLNCCDNE